VEIAHPEEQQQVRVIGLGSEKLAHQRSVFFVGLLRAALGNLLHVLGVLCLSRPGTTACKYGSSARWRQTWTMARCWRHGVTAWLEARAAGGTGRPNRKPWPPGRWGPRFWTAVRRARRYRARPAMPERCGTWCRGGVPGAIPGNAPLYRWRQWAKGDGVVGATGFDEQYRQPAARSGIMR